MPFGTLMNSRRTPRTGRNRCATTERANAVINGGFWSRAHGTLETMAFTVYLSADEGIYHGYGDKDRYELSAAGTLVVRPAGGTETYVVPGRDQVPLTDKLDPTDTGVMRLQFRQIR